MREYEANKDDGKMINIKENNMTPQQKIKYIIIASAHEHEEIPLPEIAADNVDDIYEELNEHIYDFLYELRQGDVENGHP